MPTEEEDFSKIELITHARWKEVAEQRAAAHRTLWRAQQRFERLDTFARISSRAPKKTHPLS